MKCAGNTSVCDSRDIRLVRLGIDRRERPMCGRCREAASSMGAAVVIVEAEPFRPRWLNRLTARDETGRNAA